MPDRDFPYGAFNFLVNLNGSNAPDSVLGGFSDVSGIGTEITMSEYRNGNELRNHSRKAAGMDKAQQVTLKRGLINSSDLWEWINNARRNGPTAKRDVVITLLSENRTPVERWLCRGATPSKYTGPTLAAKGNEVAMEELVLTIDAIDFELAT
jgi:phage tail-like protein